MLKPVRNSKANETRRDVVMHMLHTKSPDQTHHLYFYKRNNNKRMKKKKKKLLNERLLNANETVVDY